MNVITSSAAGVARPTSCSGRSTGCSGVTRRRSKHRFAWTPSDAPLLPALDHERPSVRVAALRALLRLGANGHIPLLVEQFERGPSKVRCLPFEVLWGHRFVLQSPALLAFARRGATR